MADTDNLDAELHLEASECPNAEGADVSAEGPQIYILQPVLEEIQAHAAEESQHEIGGILLGIVVENKHPVVVASIRGKHMAHSKLSVTFTHDSWTEFNRIIDTQYPDLKIVGWYHSHPGVGVFLSGHDLFIHQNFFTAPWHIAIVVDPLAKEWGCFSWHGQELVQEKQVVVKVLAPTSVPTAKREVESAVASPSERNEEQSMLPPKSFFQQSQQAARHSLRGVWIEGLVLMLLTMIFFTSLAIFYELQRIKARTGYLEGQLNYFSQQLAIMQQQIIALSVEQKGQEMPPSSPSVFPKSEAPGSETESKTESAPAHQNIAPSSPETAATTNQSAPPAPQPAHSSSNP